MTVLVAGNHRLKDEIRRRDDAILSSEAALEAMEARIEEKRRVLAA